MKNPLNLPAALDRARRALAAAPPGTERYALALDRVADFEAMAAPGDQIDDFPDIHTETPSITADQQRQIDADYARDIAISRTTTNRIDDVVIADLAERAR